MKTTERTTTAAPAVIRADQREYSIEPDLVDGIPADFIPEDHRAGTSAPRARLQLNPATEFLLLGVGFGAGFGVVIELFRLAAWLIAPDVGR